MGESKKLECFSPVNTSVTLQVKTVAHLQVCFTEHSEHRGLEARLEKTPTAVEPCVTNLMLSDEERSTSR